MGSRDRRERAKDQLRQEIIDAARELFVREGYNNVSMRRIAQQIEYSPTTIYLYFKDKAELLHSISEQAFTALASTLEEIGRDGHDPIKSLKDGCRAYITFGIDHPNHYRLLFMSPDNLLAYAGERPATEPPPASKRAFDHLRLAVAACVTAGVFRSRDGEAISQAVWTTLHGLTSLLITKTDFPWIDRELLIDFTLETMLRGLAANPA